jgi:glycerophosphoryl diester phosphodiesterase
MLTRTRWPYPRILAHRGGGALAPENTLVALRAGATFGFAGAEIDARLAACGTPVLTHDATVDRTTDESGLVRDFLADDLRQMDAGIGFGNEFAGERVPTLESASALARSQGQWLNVEVKAEAPDEEEAGAVIARDIARQWQGTSPSPLLSSFSTRALIGARAAAPEVPRGLLLEDLPPDWLDLARSLGCSSVHCRQDTIDGHVVQAAHAAGFGILAYTVNETARALALFELGVDAIVTDELREIRADFLTLYSVGKP